MKAVSFPSLVPWFAKGPGGTWDLDPDGFLLQVLFFTGDVSLRTGPPPPLEWVPFPPLVTAAVSITPKGAESPGSGRIGVIGA